MGSGSTWSNLENTLAGVRQDAVFSSYALNILKVVIQSSTLSPKEKIKTKASVP